MSALAPPAMTTDAADSALVEPLELDWDESDVEHDTDAGDVWQDLLEERTRAPTDDDDNFDQFFAVQRQVLTSNMHARDVKVIDRALDAITRLDLIAGVPESEINVRIMAAQELMDELHGAPPFTPVYPDMVVPDVESVRPKPMAVLAATDTSCPGTAAGQDAVTSLSTSSRASTMSKIIPATERSPKTDTSATKTLVPGPAVSRASKTCHVAAQDSAVDVFVAGTEGVLKNCVAAGPELRAEPLQDGPKSASPTTSRGKSATTGGTPRRAGSTSSNSTKKALSGEQSIAHYFTRAKSSTVLAKKKASLTSSGEQAAVAPHEESTEGEGEQSPLTPTESKDAAKHLPSPTKTPAGKRPWTGPEKEAVEPPKRPRLRGAEEGRGAERAQPIAGSVPDVTLDLDRAVATLHEHLTPPARAKSTLASLRAFDLDYKYGSCVGIARLARWNRAAKFHLAPPADLGPVLRAAAFVNKQDPQHPVWDVVPARDVLESLFVEYADVM
ncbi:hypothetical protein GGF31_004746 [Allomyces arbusculus]|nr:hypothetical protein GGF31_004746 [Allomyces arbusculus]